MKRTQVLRFPVVGGLILFVLAAAYAIEIPRAIDVDSLGGNEFKITIRMDVRADPKTVWTVLTDYNHHADWLPFMTFSRVVMQLPGTFFVEQEGRVNVLIKTYTIRVKQQIWENPQAGRMRFHAVNGDFRRLDGLWTVLPGAPGQSTLLCWFTMEPYRRAPAWAVQMIVKRYLSVMVHRLRTQAEIESRKRHA